MISPFPVTPPQTPHPVSPPPRPGSAMRVGRPPRPHAWGWRETLDGERSPRLTAPLTKPHLLVLPKIVPPTRDQALKYMTVWVHSHSNYHTI